MKRISTQWTKHLKDQISKDSFEMKLRSMYSDPVMRRLVELLREKHDINTKARYVYDDHSWPYRQSHINGQQQLIEELIELLLITKDIK